MDMKRTCILAIGIALVWSIQGTLIAPDVVVAQDGSGNFTTIVSAISAAPNNRKDYYYIKINAGIYAEYISIEAWKTHLVLIGEGADRTIITGNRSVGGGFGTYDTATVGIRGNNFIAEQITFENVAGPNMGQAVALKTEGNYHAFFKCRFVGYQDTLYTLRGYQFFRDCEIQGTIDFIFGDATVIFQNCLVKARTPLPGQSNAITAQGRMVSTKPTGIVLHNCSIVGEPDLYQHKLQIKTYLGRPWKNFSRTVIMQSFIDSIIDAKGWLDWDGHSKNAYYAEYQNRGVGAYTSRRVKWARALNDPKVAINFTVRNFIQGNTWIPTRIPYFLDLL